MQLFSLITLSFFVFNGPSDIRIGGTLVMENGEELPFFEVLRIRHRAKLEDLESFSKTGLRIYIDDNMEDISFEELKSLDIRAFELMSNRWNAPALVNIIAEIRAKNRKFIGEIGRLDVIVVRFINPENGALTTESVPFTVDGELNIRKIIFTKQEISQVFKEKDSEK